MQPLVVLTYPGHFLLTALTIRSYFQHHISVPVTVIADDLSDFAWSSYIADCEQLYKCTVIPVSQIASAARFKAGWIRQQIVKLYLDQVLPYDSWFFSDGDVEYHFAAPTDAIPYVIRSESTPNQQNQYTKDLLKVDHVKIDSRWDVSNPPFRTMQANTLRQLRQHVESVHNISFDQLHASVGGNMSEWALIANFQLTVLNQSVPLVYYPTVTIGQPVTLIPGQPDYCATCYVTDSAFGQAWWQEKQIDTDDRIWEYIVNISK